MCMTESLSVDAVQEWMDESGTSCGDCGAESFTVLETKVSDMMGSFDSISPHRAELECDDCGVVTTHSIVEEVVEEIRDD